LEEDGSACHKLGSSSLFANAVLLWGCNVLDCGGKLIDSLFDDAKETSCSWPISKYHTLLA
jgi:hypothetical protein